MLQGIVFIGVCAIVILLIYGGLAGAGLVVDLVIGTFTFIIKGLGFILGVLLTLGLLTWLLLAT